MSEPEKLIERAKKENWQVCCYGLGHMGKRLYKEIPAIFGLKPDLFTDGDDNKVDSSVLEGVLPIHLAELMTLEEDLLIFVLVDDPFDIEIREKLNENPYLHVYTLRDLLEMDLVVEYYFGTDLYEKYLQLETWKG